MAACKKSEKERMLEASKKSTEPQRVPFGALLPSNPAPPKKKVTKKK